MRYLMIRTFFINSKTGQVSFVISTRDLKKFFGVDYHSKFIESKIKPIYAKVYFEEENGYNKNNHTKKY